MHDLAIGVDLGGTNLRIAALDEEGNQLENLRTAALVDRGPDQVLAEVSTAVHGMAPRFRATHQLRGAGLGVPGILDREGGGIESAGNLPGWGHFPLRQQMERRLNVPVVLENDAYCAALGRKCAGAGYGVGHLCQISLGISM